MQDDHPGRVLLAFPSTGHDISTRFLRSYAELEAFDRQRSVEVWDALTDTRLCYLNPDFLVVTAQGDPEYHEVKGMATGLWRMKRRLLETLTAHTYVVIDAGRGVCKTGMGEPELFDERPRRTKKRRKRGS